MMFFVLVSMASADVALSEEYDVLARQVENMHKHAFDSYMLYAFPYDELMPLSCEGRRFRMRGDLDVNVANYSLTLIDSLDSLALFDRIDDFKWAASYVTDINFAKDTVVSPFEINIRVVGGLIGSHFSAEKLIEDYDGGLLRQAVDVADRLLLAFDTPTGIPYSRINLLRGVQEDFAKTTTIAEAGSYLIEFGTLSMLTGDIKYYRAARDSLMAFWRRRSGLNLVGTVINILTGQFEDISSTTGPGQDSFYEYLLKGYVLFGDEELLDIFLQAYQAVQKYQSFEGFSFKTDMYRGSFTGQSSMSPLQAFWIGLQVLSGDTAGAIKTHAYWYGLWNHWGALPEIVDVDSSGPQIGPYRDSPLRPELVESTFYLHLQNKSQQYFNMTRQFVNNLNAQSRVKCGFAGLGDVLKGTLDNRMDSFFISETLTYLYLIARRSFPSHMPYDPTKGHGVFTTEGHLMPLRAYYPYTLPNLPEAINAVGVLPQSTRWLQCRTLGVFGHLLVAHRARSKWIPKLRDPYQLLSSKFGCPLPAAFVSLPSAHLHLRAAAAVFGPSLPHIPPHWVYRREDAAILPDESARMCCVGGRSVGAPCFALPRDFVLHDSIHARVDHNVTLLDTQPSVPNHDVRALFTPVGYYERLLWGMPVRKVNPFTACETLEEDRVSAPTIAVVSRGDCTFAEKVYHSQERGYSAVIVINDEKAGDAVHVMGSLTNQAAAVGLDLYIPAALISYEDGKKLLKAAGRGDDDGRVFMYASMNVI
eukprot:GEMP01007820.1.p1 GENE.GEMP01007820.1~~GEMP01007820.1.p1  ORF type:complete len:758 (+),score=160.61 GEMP01007820.1:94-2367(+)